MKFKTAISVIILLFTSTAPVFAQVILPCIGDDPDAQACPLDTWVIALAIAASFFAAVKLYRNKRSVL